ncbi:LPS export ABC transporter permease LptF [Aromatoleum diolicum]|uniref:Lipopolysaccharide export system permease protein LptF n=1 Tax=Aromatoleum diolicum TaxID=75796 RepID=A0ABX1Q574_9RHOO|nr:LPS export ABC transporter permease LptF [Aromatoleum diolicum]NMG73508.1 LPS export ABC transporter permease LptF [Aromatoleum diolicum]
MIFSRALRREFSQSAAGVFVALFAILITTVLIRLLGQAAGGRVPSDAVLALIGFGALTELPIVLSLTLFVAVLLSLSRSYRDSEMVVWFASGLPLTAFIRPVLQFALPMVLAIAAVTLFLAPWAHLKSSEFQARLDSRDDASRVAPGVFRESAGAQRVFFVEMGAGEDGKVRNVFVSSEQNGRLGVIVAAEGSLHTDSNGDRFVVLEKGRRYEGEPGSPEYRVMEFERYSVLIEERQVASPSARTRVIPTVDLLKAPTARNLGELLGRIGVPVAALLLALMAIPLSFVNPRAGRANNLIFAILTYLVYSNAISVFQAWVSQGRLRFELAVWLPHVVVLMLLALMFYTRLAISPFWRARA